MGNVIGLVPSRTGIAIGRLVNAQLRACVICLAPSMRAARRHKYFFILATDTMSETCEELLLYVWYFMFASGWQAENCCSLSYRAFIVNNSTLGVIPSVILNLNYLKKIKYFSCIISEHITCIRKVCTRCSCSSCIFSAKIFSDLFNI